MGIVGFGRIGQVVCRKALAFGFEILACDPFVPAETATKLGGKMVDMPTLLKESDFVTLHSPLIPETRNMIGAAELAS
ncbi:D-3-phosphoglycerate dehydrogenase [Geodia barretti]|uniref:D-3-phosphoglycerate dehydrogenase n=1 Tax=Geodia barretti TaxID=519541 RepID=A0AA35T4J7_GEOBA|nr:D-3-phosphoglycerate dehydrogenase [Geodia barretti]